MKGDHEWDEPHHGLFIEGSVKDTFLGLKFFLKWFGAGIVYLVYIIISSKF